MARTRKPSPQTAAVVLTLADEPTRWSHGYDLCQALGLKAGTVYPILMRLADRGHLETQWEAEPPSGRPPRHQYRLTPGGLELARELRLARAAAGQAVEHTAPFTGRGPRTAGSRIAGVEA